MTTAYKQTHRPSLLAWSEDWQPLSTVLYTVDELGDKKERKVVQGFNIQFKS